MRSSTNSTFTPKQILPMIRPGKTIGKREMPGISALKSQHRHCLSVRQRLTHYPGWPIVFFAFSSNSTFHQKFRWPPCPEPWQMYQLTIVRPDKNLIQSRSPKEGIEKVGTRTLALRKKKKRGEGGWKGECRGSDPSQSELASPGPGCCQGPWVSWKSFKLSKKKF